MRVAINAHLLSEQSSYRGAGVSNYSAELLRALGALALERQARQNGAASSSAEIDLTAYLHATTFTTRGVRFARSALPLENPAARIAWEQISLPVHLMRQRADLVHGLVNVLPLVTPCPGVVTVHDLAFVRTPEMLPPFKRAYLTALCRASTARAAHVIAVSHQTAADLQHYFGTPAHQIAVIHNGVSARFTPRTEEAMQAFRRRKHLPDRYLLYLGTLEPRKNLERLVRAFARWRRACAPAEGAVKLVVAGAQGWCYTEIFHTVETLGMTEQVLFPGFIPGDELPDWYAAAEVFVYPSLFEGFGLPVLEAMACGTPVVCSRAPGVSEVAGEAALTFPPYDEDALATALHLVVGQPEVRDMLSTRGRDQAARFSWRRCAEETLAIYQRVHRCV
ncbi:MAG: glycosyltransferase family 4 protein [Caldilineaceae bacterium]|nr:glycosyltransferase family 4 protein [Caldilineaceae bacterium]